MSIKDSLEGTIIGKVIKNLSASEPVTTVLGAILAALVASKIDYGKLLQKDPDQIANAVSVVVVTLLGYYTNHQRLTGLPQPAAKSLTDSGSAEK